MCSRTVWCLAQGVGLSGPISNALIYQISHHCARDDSHHHPPKLIIIKLCNAAAIDKLVTENIFKISTFILHIPIQS